MNVTPTDPADPGAVDRRVTPDSSGVRVMSTSPHHILVTLSDWLSCQPAHTEFLCGKMRDHKHETRSIVQSVPGRRPDPTPNPPFTVRVGRRGSGARPISTMQLELLEPGNGEQPWLSGSPDTPM